MNTTLLLVGLAAVAFAVGACDEGATPSSHGGKRTDGVNAAKCVASGWSVEAGSGENTVCAPPVVNTRDECVAAGGQSVQLLDAPQPETCFLPTPDGGRKCDDSAQCGGYCEAPLEARDNEATMGTCSFRTKEICWNEMRRGFPTGSDCF
jgi:hypothetical protein